MIVEIFDIISWLFAICLIWLITSCGFYGHSKLYVLNAVTPNCSISQAFIANVWSKHGDFSWFLRRFSIFFSRWSLLLLYDRRETFKTDRNSSFSMLFSQKFSSIFIKNCYWQITTQLLILNKTKYFLHR